jgi:hypothetical protein
VLRIEYPHTKDAESPARAAAAAFLESRGTSPRLYRNSLVFLAADRTRLQDLDEAVRRYLAWVSILAESDLLDLSQHQMKQAEQQKENAAALVRSRIPETYQWLLVPVQPLPQQAMGWQALRLSGDEALAAKVSKKLRKDEMLITNYAGTSLRTELDRIPLWRGDHVSIKQVTEDFARYVYLPLRTMKSFLIFPIGGSKFTAALLLEKRC